MVTGYKSAVQCVSA